MIEALGSGEGTPAAIAARIYEGLPDALRGAAEASVLAHLVKLAEEGRARRTTGDPRGAAVFAAVQSGAE